MNSLLHIYPSSKFPFAFKNHALISDLEGAEEQVIEEANEPQQRFSVHGLIDDEGEEDGMNPQQWNQCKCGFSQSEKEILFQNATII